MCVDVCLCNFKIMEMSRESNCHLFSGDETKCEAILIIRWTAASFSLIGCIFIAFIIWLFQKYYIFAQRLILYLTIAAFLDNVGYLMGDMYTEGALCKLEAFWLTYFEWTVLLWVSCITFNLFVNAVLLRRTEKYEWLYHVVCWGVPLVMASLPFSGDYYGPAGAWCWIKQEYTLWRLCIWYAPLFIIIVALFVMYAVIHIHVQRKVKAWEGTYSPELERTKEVLKRDVRPLRLYPAIYLILSIFPVINRVQNAISHEPVFALTLLQTLFSPLPGAVNAIVFGLDRETISRLSITQFKLAFTSRFSSPTIIREYPCEVQSPETEESNGSLDQNLQYPIDKDDLSLVS